MWVLEREREGNRLVYMFELNFKDSRRMREEITNDGMQSLLNIYHTPQMCSNFLDSIFCVFFHLSVF